MKFPALLCSDLHLTANPRDAYRWELFPWLAKQVALKHIKSLCILGDLTDAKDYHSAELVNLVVTRVTMLSWLGAHVYILMGNHDYLRKGHAFFQFLSQIPNVTFITEPLDTSSEGEPCLFLPHTKDPAGDWAGMDFSHYRYLFLHQTVDGAIASNGQKMEGDTLPGLHAAGKVYSGDIHVPQVIGPVEYVGSPYHVHFGDRFRPRCLVLWDSEVEVLRFPTISRITLDVNSLEELADQRLRAKDQVKLRIHLGREELHQWHAIKRDATKLLTDAGVEVHGVELVAPKTRRRVRVGVAPNTSGPEDILARYVRREDMGADFLDLGLDLL